MVGTCDKEIMSHFSESPTDLCQEDPPEGVGNGCVHSNHVELHLLLVPAHHLHLEPGLEPLQVPAVVVARVIAGKTGAAGLRTCAVEISIVVYTKKTLHL